MFMCQNVARPGPPGEKPGCACLANAARVWGQPGCAIVARTLPAPFVLTTGRDRETSQRVGLPCSDTGRPGHPGGRPPSIGDAADDDGFKIEVINVRSWPTHIWASDAGPWVSLFSL